MSTLFDRQGAAWRLASNARFRWACYIGAALVLALLTVFPPLYISRAKVVPQDTSTSAGTSAIMNLLGGQAQNFATLLGGGRGSNDLYLIIGRSDSVVEEVIRGLKLAGPQATARDVNDAKIRLAKKVDVHLLLGGVLEIETTSHDAAEAQRLTVAYVSALSRQLALFGQQLITNKQRIVSRRFRGATERVSQAEAALNVFRRQNNLSAPEAELGNALSLRAGIEAQLNAKKVELETLRQFRGPDSSEFKAAQIQLAALNAQIARSAAPQTTAGGPNIAGLNLLQTRYYNLYRDFRFTQAVYEAYARSAEQVEVEQLAAESASYVQIIDPAHLDAEPHWNRSAMALFAAIVLWAIFFEWYAPATGLFRFESVAQPPPGRTS